MPELEALDAALLTAAQASFPLCTQPFAALGVPLGLDEAQVIHRLRALRQGGLLRQLSAIFDSRRLGYGSVLVAAHFSPEALEARAALLGAQGGVSHSYEREHYYNLWFTLATPPGADVEATAKGLCVLAGASAFHILPALKTYKIGVKLDLSAKGSTSAPAAPVPAPVAHSTQPVQLFESDKELIRVLQEDLPLLSRPFAALAAGLGMEEDALFDWMAEAGRRGFLRRFAAVIRHRKAGFSANGMGVWSVEEARVDEVAALLASSPAVSHCYQRPRYSDWPYNLFSMVHARTRPECDAILAELGRQTGIQERGALYSTREFKKERVKYFVEDRAAAGASRPSSALT